MFDPGKIKIVKRLKNSNIESHAFVGIQKKPSSGELEFHLPYGFDEFPDKDPKAIRRFFFRMYKSFKRFEESLRKQEEHLKEDSRSKNDQVIRKNGKELINDEGDVGLLYSKIRMIEEIISKYDDLAIQSLERKLRRSEDINYSKLYLYMDKAIYLRDGSLYIDEMNIEKNLLEIRPTDIVELFCFIFCELKDQLDDSVSDKARALAVGFREKHLSNELSLFQNDTFNETICILKDVLETINKETYYKDGDYWDFYEAVELFLYGDINVEGEFEGEFWGLKNFAFLWEEMCQVYCLKNIEYKYDNSQNKVQETILYADTCVEIEGVKWGHTYERLSQKSSYFIYKDFTNPFFVEFSKNIFRRWAKPDLVRKYIVNQVEFVKEPVRNKARSWDFSFKPKEPNVKMSVDFTQKSCASLKVKIKKAKVDLKLPSNKQDRYDFHNVPDSVYQSWRNEIQYEVFKILDFKYMPEYAFFAKTLSEKVEVDLNKQLMYEYSLWLYLRNNRNRYTIESLFVIPWYCVDNHQDTSSQELVKVLEDNRLHEKFRVASVKVEKVNFLMIQDEYNAS